MRSLKISSSFSIISTTNIFTPSFAAKINNFADLFKNNIFVRPFQQGMIFLLIFFRIKCLLTPWKEKKILILHILFSNDSIFAIFIQQRIIFLVAIFGKEYFCSSFQQTTIFHFILFVNKNILLQRICFCSYSFASKHFLRLLFSYEEHFFHKFPS